MSEALEKISLKLRDTSCTVLDTEIYRKIYEYDVSGLVHGIPDMVVLPSTVEDVVVLIRLANEYRIPVKMRGAGTTVRGESVAKGGILLDLKTLNRVLEVNKEEKTVTVEAGISWFRLYEELLTKNLTIKANGENLTPSVGSTVAVGGFGCFCAFRYGSCAEQVTAMEIVTPEGKVIQCSPESNAEIFNYSLYGYGQLGIITKLTINVREHKKFTQLYLLKYVDLQKAYEDMLTLAHDKRFDLISLVYPYRFKFMGMICGIEFNDIEELKVPDMDDLSFIRPRNILSNSFLLFNIIKNFKAFKQGSFHQMKDVFSTRVKGGTMKQPIPHLNSLIGLITWGFAQKKKVSFFNVILPEEGFVDFMDFASEKIKEFGMSRFDITCFILHVPKEVMAGYPLTPYPKKPYPSTTGVSFFASSIQSENDIKTFERFGEVILKETVKRGGGVYQYGGLNKMYAPHVIGRNHYNKLRELKGMYDPNNILNRDVIFGDGSEGDLL